MTTETTSTGPPRPFEPSAPENRRLARLLSGLWDGRDMAHGTPATLSRWRKGVGRDHEESPFLSMEVAEVLQDRPDARGEVQAAVFHALTLYAVHQQSVATTMHNGDNDLRPRGTSIGHAMRDLCVRRAPEGMSDPWKHSDNKGVVRLMESATTSHSVPELVGHLRHVVSLLRKESIPLDYVRLARDIHTWSRHWRGKAANQWAMDFYTPVNTRNDNPDTTGEEH